MYIRVLNGDDVKLYTMIQIQFQKHSQNKYTKQRKRRMGPSSNRILMEFALDNGIL